MKVTDANSTAKIEVADMIAPEITNPSCRVTHPEIVTH